MIGSITACGPFAAESQPDQASNDMVNAPATSATDKPSSASQSPTTSTSPTMPATADFCAGATFCEDFEKGPQGNGLWEDFKAINGDVFAPQAPSARSGASSLEILVTAGNEKKHSSLKRTIGNFGHVEMRFSIQIPATFGASGHTNIAHLDFGDNEDFVATLVGEDNEIGLVIKDKDRDYQLVNKVVASPNEWHEVKLVIDLPGAPPTAHLEIDGKDAVTRDILDTDFEAPPPVRLTLGPDYKTTEDQFLMRVDDLRIDARD